MLLFFQNPVRGVNEVNHSPLVGAPEFALFDFLFNGHKKKGAARLPFFDDADLNLRFLVQFDLADDGDVVPNNGFAIRKGAGKL